MGASGTGAVSGLGDHALSLIVFIVFDRAAKFLDRSCGDYLRFKRGRDSVEDKAPHNAGFALPITDPGKISEVSVIDWV